jgi:hypothetical protein
MSQTHLFDEVLDRLSIPEVPLHMLRCPASWGLRGGVQAHEADTQVGLRRYRKYKKYKKKTSSSFDT